VFAVAEMGNAAETMWMRPVGLTVAHAYCGSKRFAGGESAGAAFAGTLRQHLTSAGCIKEFLRRVEAGAALELYWSGLL